MGGRGLGPAPDLLVVLEDTKDTVLREADQLGYRGGVEGGVRVKGPAPSSSTGDTRNVAAAAFRKQQ